MPPFVPIGSSNWGIERGKHARFRSIQSIRLTKSHFARVQPGGFCAALIAAKTAPPGLHLCRGIFGGSGWMLSGAHPRRLFGLWGLGGLIKGKSVFWTLFLEAFCRPQSFEMVNPLGFLAVTLWEVKVFRVNLVSFDSLEDALSNDIKVFLKRSFMDELWRKL